MAIKTLTSFACGLEGFEHSSLEAGREWIKHFGGVQRERKFGGPESWTIDFEAENRRLHCVWSQGVIMNNGKQLPSSWRMFKG